MDKLFRHINPKTVIDIGANVGNFSRKLKHKFPDCQIIMIEANPNCEPYLRLSGIPYDIIGLSDKEGLKKLYVEKSNAIATGASFYKENTDWYSEGNYDVVEVQTSTLDTKNYFENSTIDLIKIDVQGSELNILNGGKNTLQRTNKALIEVSLLEYNLGAPTMEKVIEKMTEYGFYIKDIIEYHRIKELFNNYVFQIDILFEKSNIYY